MRDVKAIVSKMEVPAAYELRLDELGQLYETCEEAGLVQALLAAFKYGFALGVRAQKASGKREGGR